MHVFKSLMTTTFSCLAGIIAHGPACNYMFKVNNESTRLMCSLCSKLLIKTSKRHYAGLLLVPLLLSLNAFSFGIDFSRMLHFV